eukprot:gene9161-10750_t
MVAAEVVKEEEHFSKSGTWDTHGNDYNQYMEMVNFTGRYCQDSIDLAMGSGLPTGPLKVLDVACGTGMLTFPLAERVLQVPGSSVTAIDFSSEMIEILNQKNKDKNLDIAVYEMDGQNLQLPSDEYDHVFSISGLVFFPSRAKGLSEMYRVVKPGGKALVLAWDEDNFLTNALRDAWMAVAPELPFPSHLADIMTFGSPNKLEQAFLDAGFRSATVHLVPKSFKIPIERWFFTSNPVFQSVVKLIPDRYDAMEREFHRVLKLLQGQVTTISHIGIAEK